MLFNNARYNTIIDSILPEIRKTIINIDNGDDFLEALDLMFVKIETAGIASTELELILPSLYSIDLLDTEGDVLDKLEMGITEGIVGLQNIIATNSNSLCTDIGTTIVSTITEKLNDLRNSIPNLDALELAYRYNIEMYTGYATCIIQLIKDMLKLPIPSIESIIAGIVAKISDKVKSELQKITDLNPILFGIKTHLGRVTAYSTILVEIIDQYFPIPILSILLNKISIKIIEPVVDLISKQMDAARNTISDINELANTTFAIPWTVLICSIINFISEVVLPMLPL